MSQTEAAPEQFHWEPQPEAQAFIDGCIEQFLARCERSRTLADRMLRETSTRFQDWIDFLRIPETDEAIERLLRHEAHAPARVLDERLADAADEELAVEVEARVVLDGPDRDRWPRPRR